MVHEYFPTGPLPGRSTSPRSLPNHSRGVYQRRAALNGSTDSQDAVLKPEFLAGLEAAGLPQLRQNGTVRPSTRFTSPLSAFFAQTADMATPWLIQGVVPFGSPVAISGPPKSFKSLAAIDMAIAVATGRPWLDKLAVQQGPVLLQMYEDPAWEVKDRIQRFARGRGISTSELDGKLFVDTEHSFDLENDADLATLDMALHDIKPKLVVMDSLSRVFTGDENSTSEAKRIGRTWAGLCKRHNCTVAVIHHSSKHGSGNVGRRMRGSVDLFALVRGVVGIDGIDRLSASVEMAGNLGDQQEPFEFYLEKGETSEGKTLRLVTRDQDHDAQVRETVLFVLSTGSMVTAELIAKTNCNEVSLAFACQQLLEEKRIKMEGKLWKLV